MDKITKKEVKEIQNFMNNYPRKIETMKKSL